MLGKHTLDVDLNDLLLFNEELGQLLMERPGECIPLVGCTLKRLSFLVCKTLTSTSHQLESALLRLSRQILHPLSRSANRTANTTVPRDGATNNGNTEENSANAYGGASNGNLGANGVAGDLGEMEIPDVQVTIRSGQNMLQFRELTVSEMARCTPRRILISNTRRRTP